MDSTKGHIKNSPRKNPTNSDKKKRVTNPSPSDPVKPKKSHQREKSQVKETLSNVPVEERRITRGMSIQQNESKFKDVNKTTTSQKIDHLQVRPQGGSTSYKRKGTKGYEQVEKKARPVETEQELKTVIKGLEVMTSLNTVLFDTPQLSFHREFISRYNTSCLNHATTQYQKIKFSGVLPTLKSLNRNKPSEDLLNRKHLVNEIHGNKSGTIWGDYSGDDTWLNGLAAEIEVPDPTSHLSQPSAMIEMGQGERKPVTDIYPDLLLYCEKQDFIYNLAP